MLFWIFWSICCRGCFVLVIGVLLLSFGIICYRVYGVDGALRLLRGVLCFIRRIENGRGHVERRVDANVVLAFWVVGVFGVFQGSFKDHFWIVLSSGEGMLLRHEVFRGFPMFICIIVGKLTSDFRRFEFRTPTSADGRAIVELCVGVVSAVFQFLSADISVTTRICLVEDLVAKGAHITVGSMYAILNLGASGAFIGRQGTNSSYYRWFLGLFLDFRVFVLVPLGPLPIVIYNRIFWGLGSGECVRIALYSYIRLAGLRGVFMAG